MGFWLGVFIGALLVAVLGARRLLQLADDYAVAKEDVRGLRRLVAYKEGQIRALLGTGDR